MLEGKPASRIKAILYAPGCEIRVLDLYLSGPSAPQYAFECASLPSTEIQGVVKRTADAAKHPVRLEARYPARWAAPFLGIDRFIVTGIPVGEPVRLEADGRFRMVIPDLSQDPIAGAERDGELEIWARDEGTGAVVAELIPAEGGSTTAQRGRLRIQREYPQGISFAACPQNSQMNHDRFGFAIRAEAISDCAK